jgi:hypothetical protein
MTDNKKQNDNKNISICDAHISGHGRANNCTTVCASRSFRATSLRFLVGADLLMAVLDVTRLAGFLYLLDRLSDTSSVSSSDAYELSRLVSTYRPVLISKCRNCSIFKDVVSRELHQQR